MFKSCFHLQSSGTVILEDQLHLCLCLQRWQCLVRVYIQIYVFKCQYIIEAENQQCAATLDLQLVIQY